MVVLYQSISLWVRSPATCESALTALNETIFKPRMGFFVPGYDKKK